MLQTLYVADTLLGLMLNKVVNEQTSFTKMAMYKKMEKKERKEDEENGEMVEEKKERRKEDLRSQHTYATTHSGNTPHELTPTLS